ncbi:restriction endonuclease subunit S [Candidatus Roizmanbacteria bacterium]|nr:restriction endonuclease subunit S [Candidatus Roizmanbacteria bacterium]
MELETFQCADAPTETMRCMQRDGNSGDVTMPNERQDATHKEFLSVEDGKIALTVGGDDGYGFMTKWHDCKLGDLLQIKHGFAFLGEHFGRSGTHVVLTPGNFHEEGGFKETIDKAKWYSGPIPIDYVLNEGDLIVAMTEQAEGLLGSSALIPRSGIYLHNQRLGLVLVRDRKLTDQHFIYYLFNSKPVRQQIRASASGTKIRHTAPSRIADVNVSIPPLSEQKRIAGILSAYDDLIENCQRRIKILETMARDLYREWFVNFRFPGHENISLVPSALGDIPEGWEVKKVGDVFQTILGGTPSRNNPDYWEGGTIPWINSGKVNDLRIIEPSEFITSLALQKSSAKLMPKGTTVLAITGATLGQVSYLEIMTTANQSVVGIIDDSKLWSEWIYLTMCEKIKGIIMHACGGAQQHINKEIVNDVLVVMPSISIGKAFKKLISPFFNQIVTLLYQCKNLRQTSNILFPQLF